jgi:hypothetical protein
MGRKSLAFVAKAAEKQFQPDQTEKAEGAVDLDSLIDKYMKEDETMSFRDAYAKAKEELNGEE